MIGTHERPFPDPHGQVDAPVRMPDSMVQFEAEFFVEWQVAADSLRAGFATTDR